jgi:hypothetical protein
MIEMLGNFSLITNHFGQMTMDQIANTNFMVYVSNTYCILRKVRKFWINDCASQNIKQSIDSTVGIGLKLCIDIMS